MSTTPENFTASKQNLAYWLRQEATRVERDPYGEKAQMQADKKLGEDAAEWAKINGPLNQSHPLSQIAQGKFHVQSLLTESDQVRLGDDVIASHRVLTLCLEYRQVELSFYARPFRDGAQPVFYDWDHDYLCTEEIVTQQPELAVMIESLLSEPHEDFEVFKSTLTPQEERQLLLLATRALAREQAADRQASITNSSELLRG